MQRYINKYIFEIFELLNPIKIPRKVRINIKIDITRKPKYIKIPGGNCLTNDRQIIIGSINKPKVLQKRNMIDMYSFASFSILNMKPTILMLANFMLYADIIKNAVRKCKTVTFWVNK